MKRQLRLLNIEDSEDDSLLLRRHLTRAGYELIFERVDTIESMKAALERHSWDIALSDYVMPKFSALAALDLLKAMGVDLPFIILSGAIGEETAVAAMRAGAHDYLMKDNLTRLVPAIERELHDAANRREHQRAEVALRNSERLATLGRLAATIAHEINNPLEAVTNVLYLLQHHPTLDDEAREYVSIADQELARVTDIVRQALSFSRTGANPAPVAPSNIVANVLNLYTPRILAKNVEIERRLGCKDEIDAVEGELRQVFSNLIINAVDAVSDKGKVQVRVERARDMRNPVKQGIRVTIADNGPGIRPEIRKDIFEPFFTTKGSKGTGLGLWIARQIIEKHAGTIRLRSSIAPGRSGTVFSIFVPAEWNSNQRPANVMVASAAAH
ncbi:MAG TPA: ATP-binding protein [Terriglobales bacterium]|jgi:signal transduction histidine kinase|nr:ATP-binding protein [Terriglobales bacterium]